MTSRIQLTSDGHSVYANAMEAAFGSNERVIGNRDKRHISTSYAERQNLIIRMHMRRFTRLTNASSKKLENLIAAISLYFMYYNFVHIHQTLKCTPAMAPGVSDKLWDCTRHR